MSINGNRRRRLPDVFFLVSHYPCGSSSKVIQKRTKSSFSHLEGNGFVFLRKPALLVVTMNLILMDKPIGVEDTGISKNLAGAIRRKVPFQRSQDIVRNFSDQRVLPVLKHSDLILRLRTFIQMIISVWNKAFVSDNGANTFSGLFSPLSAGKLHGLVHVNIVMTIYELHLGAGTWSVFFDFLRYFACSHGITPPFISV